MFQGNNGRTLTSDFGILPIHYNVMFKINLRYDIIFRGNIDSEGVNLVVEPVDTL